MTDVSQKDNNYFSDLPYTAGYFDALNTYRARFTLALSGVETKEFSTACELGYGRGLSLAIHSATTSVDWHGTDFLLEHTEFAQQLVGSFGSCGNVMGKSFRDYFNLDQLPSFDFIALHGIWSWIGDEERQQILAFIDNKLEPGGVVYLSYNLMPGQSHLLPLRKLLLLEYKRFRRDGLGATDAIAKALDKVHQLLSREPRFFKDNQQSIQQVKYLMDKDPAYIAHEYFNESWDPMYFEQVHELISNIGLSRLCSSHPMDSIPAFSFTQEQNQLLEGTKDPVHRETLSDYITNRRFRREYWGKGLSEQPLTESNFIRLLGFFRIVQIVPESVIKLRISSDAGTFQLDNALYEEILNALSRGKTPSVAELNSALKDKGVRFDQIHEALAIMFSCGYISILPAKDPNNEIITKCRNLNSFLFKRCKNSNDVSHFASSILQGGVFVPRTHQLFLLARMETTSRTDIIKRVRAVLATNGEYLSKDGSPIVEDQQVLSELDSQFSAFEHEYFPIYEFLGIPQSLEG